MTVEKNMAKDYWKFVWNNFKSGDRASFEIIYNEFAGVLFAYGSRITSDKDLLQDCIQDVFVDIYQYGSELRNPESLEFYLFKTLKRNIIRRLKKDRLTQLADENSAPFELSFNLEEEMIREEKESKRLYRLQELLHSLSSTQRELLFLKFNSGMSYPEIGKLLDIKPDTVKKQVYRLLNYLREQAGNDLLELFFICRLRK